MPSRPPVNQAENGWTVPPRRGIRLRVDLSPVLDHLNDFAFFGGIDREQVAAVTSFFEQRAYPAGKRIIEQDTDGRRLYIIISGRVEIRLRCSTPGEEGSESVLCTAGRGEHFGEMEMLDTQPRSASARALEPTTTLELSNMGLLGIFQHDPEIFRYIVMNLARDLSRKLRAANLELAAIRPCPPAQDR